MPSFPTGHQLTVVVRYDYLLHSNCYRSSFGTLCVQCDYIRMTSHISYQLLSVSDANSVDLKGWVRWLETLGHHVCTFKEKKMLNEKLDSVLGIVLFPESQY